MIPAMDRFRELMEERWRDFEREASALSEGNLATVLGKAWYRTLDPTERSLADQVLGDWVLRGSPGQQFDALALIREFRIRSAELALHQLLAKLDHVPGPAARDLSKKVQRVIDVLKADPT